MGFRPLAGEPNPFGEFPRASDRRPMPPELPLDGFSSEEELADRVLERLDPWFLIRREVFGTHCSGARLRVDAMLRPRDGRSWRDPGVAFGVEFKSPGSNTGLNSYTKWVAQAVDYTHVEWDGYGRRVILMCPGAVGWLGGFPGNRDDDGDLLIAKRLIGQLGVGELVLRWRWGLCILMHDAMVWSERGGVSNGRHWSLDVRSGSR